MAALATSPFLRRLAVLNLGSRRATPEGIQALVDAPWLASLEHLEIGALFRGRELDAALHVLQRAAPDVDIS